MFTWSGTLTLIQVELDIYTMSLEVFVYISRISAKLFIHFFLNDCCVGGCDRLFNNNNISQQVSISWGKWLMTYVKECREYWEYCLSFAPGSLWLRESRWQEKVASWAAWWDSVFSFSHRLFPLRLYATHLEVIQRVREREKWSRVAIRQIFYEVFATVNYRRLCLVIDSNLIACCIEGAKWFVNKIM